MRRMLLRSWAGVCLLPVLAFAADPPSDYDKRAAATLYTCYSGTERKWETIKPEDVAGLTRKDKSPDGKKATYSLNFGIRDEKTGGDNRGYFRIQKGEELKDAETEQWKALPKDAATGADVFYRISKTDAGEHMQMALRRKIGPVILTIAQRRLATEKPEAAAAELGARFAQLLASAKQNGLLGGEVKVFLASGASSPLMTGEPLPLSIEDEKEKSLTLRLEAFDGEGNPIENVERLTLRLGGVFGPLVTVRYKDQVLKPENGKIVLKEPGRACDVTVVLPAGNSEAVQQALFARAQSNDPAPKPAITLDVGGKIK